MARRLLLLSTSTVFGTRYLEHALPEMDDFLGSARSVLFVPFACHHALDKSDIQVFYFHFVFDRQKINELHFLEPGNQLLVENFREQNAAPLVAGERKYPDSFFICF